MKTKNKLLALLEIAIVLFSLFLVALPGVAAEQTSQKASASEVTTASEDDYVLDIYGNANEDDTIDMRDLTYVKLIFFGKKPETELADAKYDGKINPLDFIQIKLIIVGKEKELTIVDFADRIVTVRKPIKKIVVLATDQAEAVKAVGGKDKVVGVGNLINEEKTLFPELSKLPSVGRWSDPDCEVILELKPDIVIAHKSQALELEDKLEPSITVVSLSFSLPVRMIEQTEKLGYILNKRNEAKDFIDFIEGYMVTINEQVAKLSEDEKPRVYVEGYSDYKAQGKGSKGAHLCIMAGGVNIAGELPSGKVDPEWVIEQNPHIIVKYVSRTKVSCGYNEDNPAEMKAAREDIMSRPGFGGIEAVKNGRVYPIAPHLIKVPYIVGVTYHAKWFHPELFKDLDPKEAFQQYLTEFMGLDYDLDKHGVFVYHPEEHPDGK